MTTRKLTRAVSPAVRLPDPAKQHLQSLLSALHDIEGAIIIAAAALREERAPTGMCVARILRTQVSNRLSVEIDHAKQFFSLELPSHGELES